IPLAIFFSRILFRTGLVVTSSEDCFGIWEMQRVEVAGGCDGGKETLHKNNAIVNSLESSQGEEAQS
ncbi:hypothetical protein BDFG_09474, partial [Blastomyces dermatitidis ATCC 26199]